VYDFRNNLADYLSLVELSGSRVMVRRFKKPVAMLVPFDRKEVDYKQFFGFRGKRGETGASYVNRIRRSKAERERIERLRNGLI
jgi:antitoxin (DNA-binding transcriptional repressor) of toxin-antitoxin stability system